MKKELHNGVNIPIIGFGTYQISEGDEISQSISWALEAGYRHIDTAKIYQNEEGVGIAIQVSGVPREEIFLTTKLWNPDQGYESTLSAFQESLNKLGTDYVDLYLIHWPTADGTLKESINKRQETWRAMEEIYKSGKAKAIGVSNYTIKHLEEMKEYATISPMVNQVEFHPFLYQKELLEYCKQNNIILEAYRALTRKNKIDDETLLKIGEKYNKSSSQVLLRWSIQQGCVPLAKSSKQEHMQENFNIFDFELTQEDMQTINNLNQDLRFSPDPTNLI